MRRHSSGLVSASTRGSCLMALNSRCSSSAARQGDQVRVNLGHFLGDQAVLNGLGAVGEGLFVAEGHGTETHQIVAGRAHVLDVFFETLGRADGAQLAGGIDHDRNGIVVTRGYAPNPYDEERGL